MKNYLLYRNATLIALTAALTTVAVQCKKYDPRKIASTSWNPNLAVPIAYGSFDVYDVFARTDSSDIFIIDPLSGAVALVYRGEVVSYNAGDIIQVSDFGTDVIYTNSELGMPVGASFSGTATANNTSQLTAAVNSGVELHTMLMKQGSLSITVTSDIQHNHNINISFPELKLGGTSLTRTIPLTYSGMSPLVHTETIDLTNYLGNFTRNNTTFNELDVNTTVTINGTGGPISGVENVQLNLQFSGLQFSQANGYFGQQSVGFDNDTILLRIFENEPDGYFELIDPRVRFTVENSFGFPIQLNFQNLKTIDISNGNEFPISGFPSTLNISAPSMAGQVATAVLELNNGNTTNLITVITPTPKYFFFEAAGISNPAGNTGTLNFITDTSYFKVHAEVELPLEGLAYGFGVSDTSEFSFGENLENIESLMFRINVNNGFPVELLAQVTLLDSNYIPLFSLLNTPQQVVESASINTLTGRVTTPTRKITDILLNEQQLQLISQARYVHLYGLSNSKNGTSGQIVKIYDDYVIDLKLGMQVQGKFNVRP
jgi:hypothetical protein